MTARVTSDFWVSAYLRRCAVAGVVAVLRRRGAAEAGAVMIKVDRLDGTSSLLGPAPQSEAGEDGERRFAPLHREDAIDSAAAEARLKRETAFDPDLWIVEVEDRAGRAFL
ncbi:DUF1491 family protein [Lichenibacterium ramalinae]|uniref:DUF1491 family protein n=1 Tax=Lichenibacterium ramalinae TaxID=2316527 RepID=A0A4Q2RFT3_9HYPH|nr:DUF1491 family protein [Lichenibacterium ramalinae]RYB06277.1 DUF1491 family protein [Lichenibacterium ramalinae]